MLKFLAWVFSGTSRHWREIRGYEKGLSGRIWTIVGMLLLVGGCVLSEWLVLKYISEWMLQDKLVLFSLLGLIALVVCMITSTVDFCSVFCYVAFRNAFFGIVMTAARLAEKQRKKRRQEEFSDVEPQQEIEVKTYKALDVFIGILAIACVVFTVISAFVVISCWVKGQ